MIKALTNSVFLIALGLIISSASSSNRKRDALDSILLYQNEELISKWYEFDDQKSVTIYSESANDTLTFFCSSDVGWMDSSSVTLTFKSETNTKYIETPKFSRINTPKFSNQVSFHLALADLNASSGKIDLWRHTQAGSKQVFEINFSEKVR